MLQNFHLTRSKQAVSSSQEELKLGTSAGVSLMDPAGDNHAGAPNTGWKASLKGGK